MNGQPTEELHNQPLCLNCKAPLSDRFCPHCGQDSKEFKRSVWLISVQFFETFTDFDNKLWASLGPLIFRPGYLTRKFLDGKRKSYLNPIQMYAFFSFLFFLTAFYYPNLSASSEGENLINGIESDLYGNDSSTALNPDTSNATISFGTGDSIRLKRNKNRKIELDSGYRSLAEYEAWQAARPENERHGFFSRRVSRQLISIVGKINRGEKGLVANYFDVFKGNIPNIMILLLPVFALILKVLYVRRRFYYVEHLIFAIHLHCFTFLLLSINNVISRSFSWGNSISGFLYFTLFLYAYLALKNMYRQGWFKTFFKFNLLGFNYSLCLVIAMLCNLLVSALLL